jgi:hypothetical protein
MVDLGAAFCLASSLFVTILALDPDITGSARIQIGFFAGFLLFGGLA